MDRNALISLTRYGPKLGPGMMDHGIMMQHGMMGGPSTMSHDIGMMGPQNNAWP